MTDADVHHGVGKVAIVRYKQIEEVLCKIFGVVPSDLKAFRARLRHLRNIGIPHDLPKPGSGAQITYTRENLVEMIIALELEILGISPKRTVSLSLDAILPGAFGLPTDNMYMLIIPGHGFAAREAASITVNRLDATELSQIVSDQRRLLIVNLSASLDMMEALTVLPDHSASGSC